MGASASVVHVIRPAAGGMRAHVASLAPLLMQRGYDVTVAGPLHDVLRRELSQAGVPWANLPLPDRPSWRGVRDAARPVAKLLRSRNADIIHAHGFLAAMVSHAAARRLEAPPRLVVTAHVFPQMIGGWWERALRRWGYQGVLRAADAIIAPSAAVRDALLDVDASAGPKIQVVFNGLDAARYRARLDVGLRREQLGLDPAAAAVGFVGRLAREKGPDLFLEAAAAVTRDIPNVDYLLAGDGPLRDELEQQAHDLHLTGCCVFLGEREDVPQILAALDALVIPSRQEAFGLVALEGVAAGTPVIASEVGGLAEILRGAPDVAFTPAGDTKALAAAIIRVLDRVPEDDEELISEAEQAGAGAPSVDDLLVSEDEYDLDADLHKGLQAARAGSVPSGQEFVAGRFSLGAMARQTADVYEDLLGGAARPALSAGDERE
jgi:glycosyltransferase involved in cell wall biosynthesis